MECLYSQKLFRVEEVEMIEWVERFEGIIVAVCFVGQ